MQRGFSTVIDTNLYKMVVIACYITIDHVRSRRNIDDLENYNFKRKYYKESTLPLPGTGGTVVKEQEG